LKKKKQCIKRGETPTLFRTQMKTARNIGKGGGERKERSFPIVITPQTKTIARKLTERETAFQKKRGKTKIWLPARKRNTAQAEQWCYLRANTEGELEQKKQNNEDGRKRGNS